MGGSFQLGALFGGAGCFEIGAAAFDGGLFGAAFGVAQANMASAKGTAKLGALKGFFTYLVANPRVASTLVHKVVTSTKSHDGVLAQTFFSGGAIALGTEADGRRERNVRHFHDEVRVERRAPGQAQLARQSHEEQQSQSVV